MSIIPIYNCNEHTVKPTEQRINTAVYNRDKIHEVKTALSILQVNLEKNTNELQSLNLKIQNNPDREELRDTLENYTTNKKFEEKFNEMLEYIEAYITNSTPRTFESPTVNTELENRIKALEEKINTLQIHRISNDTNVNPVPKLFIKSKPKPSV